MAVNKVIYGETTLIDLTPDTVTAEKILTGFTAHDASGATITGTCSYDADTQDATVKVDEILSGKSAYARGAMLTGNMPNNGAVSLTISTVDGDVIIPQGYHDGSGKVGILSTEKAKIIAGNIKKGITILGVEGTLEPSSQVTVQAKSATPKSTAQTILPDSGYDYLSQVTVNAIPYVETDNAAGGKTVTIAGA